MMSLPIMMSNQRRKQRIMTDSITDAGQYEPYNEQFTPAFVITLLQQQGLLREVILQLTDSQTTGQQQLWISDLSSAPDHQALHTPFENLTYDTREVLTNSLLVCKGKGFKPQYLQSEQTTHLQWYIATTDYSEYTHASGIIVSDASKALAVLADAYFDYPQEKLTLIGITGTKGKTTTTYMTHAILNAYTAGKTALSTSIATCVDGSTFVPAHLTTPESLQLHELMRQAVDHGCTHMVVEVSSQAYKVSRVYGITFDVGVITNIGLDHISPMEHPSFEDYLYCKRQILHNCKHAVISLDSEYAPLLVADARKNALAITALSDTYPDYREHRAQQYASVDTMMYLTNNNSNNNNGDTTDNTNVEYTLITPQTKVVLRSALPGYFNVVNAAFACAIAHAVHIPLTETTLDALAHVHVPGRMEQIKGAPNMLGYVDFAHNYMSCSAFIHEIEQWHKQDNPYIVVVIGSTGEKAFDRRKGIVDALDGHVDAYYFTSDDVYDEDPYSIDKEMSNYVTHPRALKSVHIEPDRVQAIRQAVTDNTPIAQQGRQVIILALGKGDDTYIASAHGTYIEYPGDAAVLKQTFHELYAQ